MYGNDNPSFPDELDFFVCEGGWVAGWMSWPIERADQMLLAPARRWPTDRAPTRVS